MIYSLKNDLQSPFIFILFLKSKQNKKKTLNVTPYLEKVVCEKPNQGSGSGYLLGSYGWWVTVDKQYKGDGFGDSGL